MGNQLIGIAPSQILPVERYLADYSNPELKFVFDSSLGSTRFLKVARAKIESQEGLIVIKVFAIHDPSLPLQFHIKRLEDIRKKLSSAVNCIPFQKVLQNDKAAFIIREYVKFSLYDRISTRPFLTDIEKRWITFQILYALHQCHKVGVCHGDIKLENVMITSWNWILLVDFASFKPAFLPENNPADYSYFFDTSRRRNCYLAPERFKRVTNTTDSLLNEPSCDFAELTPAMDIFSAGCILLELWNELHVPFDYSQLLAYRNGKHSPEKDLKKLDNPNLRSLIESMIQIDPKNRLSAEEYLAQERGKLFPEYFFSFLQSYMLIFSSNPILSPDEKILRLKNDIGSIFKFLGPVNDKGDSSKSISRECEGLVIITSLVTACIRGLQDCTSKLHSLEILIELAMHANDETILDRILPYIMYLVQDPTPRVKIAAIDTITKCLSFVEKIQRSDINIFPEYILPGLTPLATDPNTCVRAAYAKNIATLAEKAVKYLDQIQNDWYDQNQNTFNYELELQTLHEMVQQTVLKLLTDPQTVVKQTLMESGITKLCVFFGKQKANDIILSHIITFLNDKEDKELRSSFFNCIIGVAAYIGWHCSIILTPLLLQGLKDSCEFVTVKSINAMSNLTELGLLNKPSVCELISESACFLVHPNLWIRQAVAGFVSTTAKVMSILDVQCKIMPIIQIYMRHELIQIERIDLLMESLVPPIPRSVYDSIISYSDMEAFLDVLKQRMSFRKDNLTISGNELQSTSLQNLFKRLESLGINPQIEEYILKMSPHLQKIHKYKTKADAKLNRQSEGKMEIFSNASNVKSNCFSFSHEPPNKEFVRKLQRTNTSGSIDTNVNSEWNYSSEMLVRQTESVTSGGPPSRSTYSRPSSPSFDNHHLNTDPSSNISLQERSYIQCGSNKSKCYIELMNLKARQQDYYLEALRGIEWADQEAWQPSLLPPNWHLRGVLVAHLHEHKGAVTRLCSLPDSPYFASSSSDGCVRLWDCSRMEGKNIANRSKQHFKLPGDASVNGIVACEGGQSIAATGLDGTIRILRLDPASSKMNAICSKQLHPEDEGFAVDIQSLDSGSQSVVVYATLYGSIVGWDLRSPGIAWKLENELKQGFITSFCIDSNHNWLAVGTRNGTHTAWDLRFQLKITSIDHPVSGVRIKKVITHPTKHSWIISSIQGNNEVSMWNLETGFRERVLWGSTSPPFSVPKSQEISNCVSAMYAGCTDNSPFLLAGGTDQRVRFWNLANSTESYLAIPAANDIPGTSLQYINRLIDGTDVTYEEANSRIRDKKCEDNLKPGYEAPPIGHKDSISDITLCKGTQVFVVTSSRDGVIKLWK